MSLKLIFARLIDPLVVTYQLLVVNRRLIFPTIIGLVLALTIVSQSGIIIESYREQIFKEIVFQNYSEFETERGRTLAGTGKGLEAKLPYRLWASYKTCAEKILR